MVTLRGLCSPVSLIPVRHIHFSTAICQSSISVSPYLFQFATTTTYYYFLNKTDLPMTYIQIPFCVSYDFTSCPVCASNSIPSFVNHYSSPLQPFLPTCVNHYVLRIPFHTGYTIISFCASELPFCASNSSPSCVYQNSILHLQFHSILYLPLFYPVPNNSFHPGYTIIPILFHSVDTIIPVLFHPGYAKIAFCTSNSITSFAFAAPQRPTLLPFPNKELTCCCRLVRLNPGLQIDRLVGYH